MMKNKNIRKKTLTAVGAVVAAGLTPGIIAATPSCLPVQDTYMGVTAAEVVVIDGMIYSFDMVHPVPPNTQLIMVCNILQDQLLL